MSLRPAVILASLVLSGPAAAVTTTPPRITVHDGTVTAKLQAAPLPEVLAELTAAIDATLVGDVTDQRTVTLELRRVPLADAFARLLGTQSFTLTYGADGKLKRIILVPEAGQAPVAPSGLAANQHGMPQAAGDEVKEAAQRVGDFLRSNRLVPVGRSLAGSLGTDNPTFGEILQAALKSEAPRVRAQARRVMVEALTVDPEVKTSLATWLGHIPEDKLVGLLRGLAGVDAPQLAEAFARHGGSGELTQSMRAALARMQAQPVGTPAAP